ncbi:M56 family metallopeptidase [Actinokineospora sp. NPDC004072]
MIVAAALLLGAAVTAWLLPAHLRKLTTSRVDPVVAIAWWLVSCAGVLGTGAAGVVLVVLPDHGPARELLAWIHSCWTALSHGDLPTVEDGIGVLGALAVAAAAVRTGAVALRRRSRSRAERRRQLDLLRVVVGPAAQTSPVVWLDVHQPVAYSVAGRPGVVVVSSGLRDHLSAEEVAAVLAHERAHVRGGHHLLVGLADALGTALPFLPLTRALPAAIRTLVEMAADRAAAATCGAAAVRGALTRIGLTASPPGALSIADDDVGGRIERLRRPPRSGRVQRAVELALTLPAAIALPGAVGIGILAAGALTCPLLPW